MNADGCLICSSDLIYTENSEQMTCNICKTIFNSNANCVKGHFICDSCHELDGFGFIETICKKNTSVNTILIANSIMSNPKIKLHGPEHHFLVPAVMITSYYNKIGKSELINEKLNIAKERAKNILDGFCGFYGNC